jgi:hypothetical protein
MPASTLLPPAVDGARLYDQLRAASEGIKRFHALRTALGAGLFEHLERPAAAPALAAARGLDPVLTEALCALLGEMGLLRREAEGWRRTELAALYLDPRSSLFQGEVLRCMEEGFDLWRRLPELLRQGPVDMAREQVFKGNFIDALGREGLLREVHACAEAIAAAPGFDTARLALDLGGGHGLYAWALCERNPGLHAVVLDTPGTQPVFESFADEFGYQRMQFRPGNLFRDDWGRGYDLIFFSYNPGGKQRSILERIHQALAPGGLFVTKHAYYNAAEGSKSPLLDLEWLLTRFPGIDKQPNVYRFANEMPREEFLPFFLERYELLAHLDARQFASPDLGKFGDRLDSQIIIGRKR